MELPDNLPPAIFVFGPSTIVEALWSVGWKEGDWVAALFRDNHDDPWRLTYRFRYYRDNKIWGSDDEKHVTRMKANNNSDAAREEMIRVMTGLAHVVAITMEGELDSIRVGGDTDMAIQWIRTRPWIIMDGQIYKVNQGGLFRCCLASLDDAMVFRELPPKEGDTVHCKYCQDKAGMIFKEGTWQWAGPSPTQD